MKTQFKTQKQNSKSQIVSSEAGFEIWNFCFGISRRALFLLPLLLLAFFSCKNEAAEKAKQDSLAKSEARANYIKAIDSTEKVHNRTKSKKDAINAMKAYNDFIVSNPQDTMAAEYLFRESFLAIEVGNYEQAAALMENIIEQHKNYRRYEDVVFSAANVYDMYLEQVNHGDERARQLYDFIITHYPNTKQASDAAFLKQYVGKPDSVMYNDMMKKADSAAKAGQHMKK